MLVVMECGADVAPTTYVREKVKDRRREKLRTKELTDLSDRRNLRGVTVGRRSNCHGGWRHKSKRAVLYGMVSTPAATAATAVICGRKHRR
uniref:Uncharacterized protein n=1 Tax=Lactuca sativa TaxID=4236 RepID=A0A9R1W133_LACSA|nr:hypothetical protein LSAT_V11C300124280 [Lactuca sativa]